MQSELPIVIKRPPLRYHGSKFRIAPWIISHFPEHKNYVEPFSGGAGVLLRKQPSKVEVYNDLDEQVVNFFRVLRDLDQRMELVELLEFTPFSRAEHVLSYEPTLNPVESARRFIFRCYSGHGTCSVDPADSNGFRSCDIDTGKSYAKEWNGIPAAIAAAARRMKDVTIENLHYLKLIPKFDHKNTLFYCDPPYLMDTRKAGGKGYVHEMTRSDHIELAWLLKRLKGKVIISGYDHPLYRELYADWNHDEKHTTANGQVGTVPRVEHIWMNF